MNLINNPLVTIYINKPQFNKKSDYQRYPRVLSRDISILKRNKVDFLYLPTTKQIYPRGKNRMIKIHSFRKQLCGKLRFGHFEAGGGGRGSVFQSVCELCPVSLKLY